MKWPFTLIVLSVLAACFVIASGSLAAETNKTILRLEATRSAVTATAAKTEGNKEAAVDLERAVAALKNADASLKEGTSMFGFGSMTPEAEQEVKISVDAADIAVTTALSRVELVHASAELEALEKKFATVKAKLKIFDDRREELERLRREAEACRKISNELEIIKLEKVTLASQVDKLDEERSRADKIKIELLELTRKMDEIKAENSRLSALLQTQSPEIKATAAVPPPEEAAKKPLKKP
jgi:hypothetical protein